MFYSHEVLTSRRYGVATIWLVATLGNKASPKKVNRKTILEVNIPKACDVVIEPEAPMALRLQSNLLCGISRVYFQQCGYVLVDAQGVQQQMRHLIRAVQARTSKVDMETGRNARPEQLLLSDDPNFMPGADFELDIDLLDMNGDFPGSSLQTSLLASSQSSRSFDLAAHIVVPSSDQGLGGLNLGDIVYPPSGSGAGGEMPLLDDNEQLLPEAEFSFDQDRNLFELDNISSTPLHRSVNQADTRGTAGLIVPEYNLDDAPANVEAVAETGPLDADGGMAVDDAPAQPDPDGDIVMSDGHADGHVQPEPQALSEHQASQEENEDAQAMARRERTRRRLQADNTTEVRKTDLQSWNVNYLSNMSIIRSKRDVARANAQSKKNADWWVWGAGIGGVGYDLRQLNNVDHPLAMFQGDRLRELLIGPITSRKRPSPDNEAEEGRRVRARGEDGERLSLHPDQEIDLPMDDTEDIPPEIARRAPTPLDRASAGGEFSSSAMPWNQTLVARSSQIGRSNVPSLRGRESSAAIPGPPAHAAQRLTSASPLLGRGLPLRSLSRQSSAGPVNLGEAGGYTSSDRGLFPEPPGSASFDQFDRFGPAANAESSSIAEPGWSQKQLDAESNNFLAFITQAISQNVERGEPSLGTDPPGILFEDLLQPSQNTHVVAAQGLLHVLSLATKGALRVQQDQAQFGQPMWIRLAQETVPESATAEAA